MENTKKCRLCKSQIDRDAKKCPVCRGIQNRLFSPVVPFLLTNIFLVLLIGLVGWAVYDVGSEDFSEKGKHYKDDLVIVESELKFGKSECDKDTIAVIGKLKNNSSVNWGQIGFEIRCFSSDGKLIDTTQDSDWDYVVPAGQELPFKVSFDRYFPQDRYASHEAKVIYAVEKSW